MNFKLPFILSVVRDCSISEACIFDNFNPHVFDILRVSALLPSLPFSSLLLHFPLVLQFKIAQFETCFDMEAFSLCPKSSIGDTGRCPHLGQFLRGL